MKADKRKKQQVCYVDVGGTFTDAFIVDEEGDFVLGKAPSNPEDISECFFNSIKTAAEEVDLSLEQLFSELEILGYGATVVVNALLTRKGVQPGLIITRGFEDILLIERAVQTWTEYSRIDRMHVPVHRHLEPLIPKSMIKGITERVDCLGQIQIPLYENEVEEAVLELIKNDVKAIAICFLWSFINDSHERRAGKIALEIINRSGKQIPVYLSVDISPVRRELSRVNATIIEAYTSPFMKRSLGNMEIKLKEYGFKGTQQIMQSSGGLAPVKHIKAVETIQSGPVGGLIGARYLGNLYGIDNIITSDVGGTSFDVGLINKGLLTINREPISVKMILGVPMIEIISIGAGGGTIARTDPLTNRMEVGPESAGAVPGPVCYDRGGLHPTVTDADLVLGYLNPDYFLGGRIKLNKKKSEEIIKKELADPLGISMIKAATGIKEILDTKMKETILSLVAMRGFEISDYNLFSFGAAGPTHVAGYTKNLPLKGIMMFPYSAVFSAFGASSADYEHHYTKASNIVIPPSPDNEIKRQVGHKISELWTELENRAIEQMVEEGFSKDQIHLRHLAMIRYGRQLNDLVVTSPISRVDSPEAFDELIKAFESLYDQVYTRSARFPEGGYDIFELGLVSYVIKIKPKIKKRSLSSKKPTGDSLKGYRKAYFDEEIIDTPIYELARLEPGNVISGPIIIEDPTTTFVVPPEKSIEIDQYTVLWLK